MSNHFLSIIFFLSLCCRPIDWSESCLAVGSYGAGEGGEDSSGPASDNRWHQGGRCWWENESVDVDLSMVAIVA